MSLDSKALLSALTSHAKRLKIFDRVIGYDPKNVPGDGLTCCVFAEMLTARPSTGLNRSAALMVWVIRVMLPISARQLDDTEPAVVDAADKVVRSLMGAFTLGGLVRNVDIRGQAGTPLRVDFGYVEITGTVYRFAEIITPLIVNDVWTEVP